MRIRMRRRLIAGVAIGVLAGAAGGIVLVRGTAKSGAAAANPQATVLEFSSADLAFVEARPLKRWLPISGTMQPVRQATVRSKLAGEIRQLPVREGETVQAGQLLVRFDTVDLEVKLAERLGALESAKAQLALAEKTRAMNVKLLNDRFISQNAFDGSESSYSVAQGSVKSAEALAKLAQNAIKDAVVTSPLSGVVAKRHVQPGERVAFDVPLVTVVDLREMELAALVPAVDVPELKIGMPVELSVDGFADRRFTGRVERINPSTEPGTRAIHVFVGLKNPDGALKSGMFSTGRIAIASSAPMPTLPLGAVRTEAGQSFVWTIHDGKLARRIVSLGRRDDEAGVVELRTMLPPDLPVLAARFDNLTEGAPAIAKSAAPTSSPASASAPPRG